MKSGACYIESSLRSCQNEQDQQQQKYVSVVGAAAGDLERSERGAQCWTWPGRTGGNTKEDSGNRNS